MYIEYGLKKIVIYFLDKNLQSIYNLRKKLFE